MHGSMMLFLFAIPMVEEFRCLSDAEDSRHPRTSLSRGLTAYGYWCYLFGGTILTVALIAGRVAPNSGWFMYTPLSSNVFYARHEMRDVWLLGVTFVEISALSLAVEIVVSILKMRAPGMSLDRMPIFAWLHPGDSDDDDRGLSAADPRLDPARSRTRRSVCHSSTRRVVEMRCYGKHLFWLFGHPDVYIIFLPMAGVLSTIIPVFANRPLVGYRAIVVAIIALAFLSFGIWVHHMFTVGIPHLALAFFSAGSAIVAVPTAVAWSSPGLLHWRYGRPRWGRADALCVRFLLHLRDGRPDGSHARHGSVRLAGPRYLFRRRPTCTMWWPARLPSPCLRRFLLLDAVADRSYRRASAFGTGGSGWSSLEFNHDFLHDAPDRDFVACPAGSTLIPDMKAGIGSICCLRSAGSS